MRLPRLARATTVITLGVIGVGGLVRATGSGDGCPDWPRCFGRWIPPLEKHALIEYSHRTIGALAIAMLLVTAYVVVRHHRRERALLIPTLIATPSILLQAVLGAVVVHVKSTPSLDWLEPWLVTFHIATAMGLIALLVVITARAFELLWVPAYRNGTSQPTEARALRHWGLAAAAAVFGLIVIGAFVRGERAGLAFADWPLMNGRLIPSFEPAGAAANFTHRASALAAGIVLGIFVMKAWRARGTAGLTARFALVAGIGFVAQSVVGGIQVLTNLGAAAVTAHVALAGIVWASIVAAAVTVPRARYLPWTRSPRLREPAPISGAQVDTAVARAVPLSSTLGAYIRLTKPRIIVLLLITTVPTMALATGGMPDLGLTLATLVGGTLAAASANTFNMVLDQDIDALMSRTRNRPLPAHEVSATRAAWLGLFLGAASLVLMTATVNLLAAMLAQAAIAFYVFVYTIGLKRSTPQNIVIGGAAGAAPVLVGWAAVTGTLALEAWLLFAIIFAWTPAHFWALAMRYQHDYAAAGVPMMPVVNGERITRRLILIYTIVTVLMTLALAPVAGMGTVYLIAAAGLGAWFIADATRLIREQTTRAAMRVFRTSISYLGLVFIAAGVDAVVR